MFVVCLLQAYSSKYWMYLFSWRLTFSLLAFNFSINLIVHLLLYIDFSSRFLRFITFSLRLYYYVIIVISSIPRCAVYTVWLPLYLMIPLSTCLCQPLCLIWPLSVHLFDCHSIVIWNELICIYLIPLAIRFCFHLLIRECRIFRELDHRFLSNVRCFTHFRLFC